MARPDGWRRSALTPRAGRPAWTTCRGGSSPRRLSAPSRRSSARGKRCCRISRRTSRRTWCEARSASPGGGALLPGLASRIETATGIRPCRGRPAAVRHPGNSRDPRARRWPVQRPGCLSAAARSRRRPRAVVSPTTDASALGHLEMSLTPGACLSVPGITFPGHLAAANLHHALRDCIRTSNQSLRPFLSFA